VHLYYGVLGLNHGVVLAVRRVTTAQALIRPVESEKPTTSQSSQVKGEDEDDAEAKGWNVFVDNSTAQSKVYYMNMGTGEVVWSIPQAMDVWHLFSCLEALDVSFNRLVDLPPVSTVSVAAAHDHTSYSMRFRACSVCPL